MMKRSLTKEILEHLIVCDVSFILSGIFMPYGAGIRKRMRRMEKEAARCLHDFSKHSRASVSATLSKLKQKGLVRTKGPKKKTLWLITKEGKKHFKTANAGQEPPPSDGKIRLVIYDIPEKLRSYRIWLRHRLLACDYNFLQKSVWLGSRPLPKELLRELKERGLSSHVHVIGLEKFVSSPAKE